MRSLSVRLPMPSRPVDPLVSVVLPVFNEVGVLERLRAEVTAALAEGGCRGEIVFVDDGSGDGSGETLDRFAAEDPTVRVVHFSRNFGQQAAVQAGLEHAAGDAVVVMDSDLQDDPRAIVTFVEQWRAGFDVVYAVRRNRKEGPVKRMLFSGFYRVLSAVSEVPIPRDAGNFGLIDRRVVEAIRSMGDDDRYFPGLRNWVGFRQTGVPVERLERYDDDPRISLWGLFRLARTAVFSFSRVPLTFFYLLAATALVVALTAATFAVVVGLRGAAPSPTALVVAAAAGLAALNALGIAVLGEYVARIHDSVRRRPQYLVDERGGDSDGGDLVGHVEQTFGRPHRVPTPVADEVSSPTTGLLTR